MRSSEPADSSATDSNPPSFGCTAEGVSVISYQMFGAVFAGTVPSTVLEIVTAFLKLRCCSFHWVLLTSLTLELLTEPAAASEVVLNFSFTVAILFPAS